MDSKETQIVAQLEANIKLKLESDSLLSRFGLDAKPVDEPEVENAVLHMLHAIGENPGRQGLIDTPRRVAKAYRELVSGYTTDPVELLNNAVFDIAYDDMVGRQPYRILQPLRTSYAAIQSVTLTLATCPKTKWSVLARYRASSTCFHGGCRFRSALRDKSPNSLSRCWIRAASLL